MLSYMEGMGRSDMCSVNYSSTPYPDAYLADSLAKAWEARWGNVGIVRDIFGGFHVGWTR